MNPPARRRYLLVCPENLSAREAALAEELARAGELWIVTPGPVDPAGRPPRGARLLSLPGLRRMRGTWQPDFVVHASAPSPVLHWKVWWWKRRRCPAALFGGVPPPSPPTGAGRWRRRAFGWAVDSLDFYLAADEAAAGQLEREGVPRGRISVTGGAGTLPDFLERRRRAEEQSVLWVEEDLSLHSPSTKPLLYSIPYLREQGWDVRGWCLTADETARTGAEIREFPPPPDRLRQFLPYWFFACANLYGIRQTILKGRPPARIVQTVGGAFLGADIAAIHFVNHVWLRKQLALRPRSLKEFAMVAMTLLGVAKDQLQFSNPRCRLFLPVSDSIGEEVRRRCLPGAEVETLANTYDETRFNPSVRQQWREPIRRELGFTETATVFAFASQGHYKRKGFWLALEGLSRLRRREDLPKARGIKFLVVGGLPGTLAKLQAELAAGYPDWKAWVVFVGSQPAVERYLSAADAFLLPSYFEAFCLAEIEAGALGLPLLLTPHPGTEMILQDGVNGLRLSYDPAELTASLADFLVRGLPPFAASPGRALERGAYGRALAALYQRVGSARSDAGLPLRQ